MTLRLPEPPNRRARQWMRQRRIQPNRIKFLFDLMKPNPNPPPGLTLPQLAKRLRVSEAAARQYASDFGYKLSDGRKLSWTKQRRAQSQQVDWSLADWSHPDSVIAHLLDVSRQRVHVMRRQLGHKPVDALRWKRSQRGSLALLNK